MDKYNCLLVMQNDPFEHILMFMDKLSIYIICQTCKHYSKHIKQFKEELFSDANKNITKILKRLFRNGYDEFMELMKITNSFLSGSFIVPCLLGETWCDSHLSLHVLNPSVEAGMRIHDFLRKDCGNCWTSYFKLVSGDVGKKVVYARKYWCPIVVHFILPDIAHSYYDLQNLVNRANELDICKNIYCYDGSYHLSVSHLDAILSKKLFSDGMPKDDNECEKYIERCNLYKNYGFNVKIKHADEVLKYGYYFGGHYDLPEKFPITFYGIVYKWLVDGMIISGL